MDPVKYIFEKLALTGRIARWQVLLSEIDIVYVTQKAIKGSALADYLAQQPLQDIGCLSGCHLALVLPRLTFGLQFLTVVITETKFLFNVLFAFLKNKKKSSSILFYMTNL